MEGSEMWRKTSRYKRFKFAFWKLRSVITSWGAEIGAETFWSWKTQDISKEVQLLSWFTHYKQCCRLSGTINVCKFFECLKFKRAELLGQNKVPESPEECHKITSSHFAGILVPNKRWCGSKPPEACPVKISRTVRETLRQFVPRQLVPWVSYRPNLTMLFGQASWTHLQEVTKGDELSYYINRGIIVRNELSGDEQVWMNSVCETSLLFNLVIH